MKCREGERKEGSDGERKGKRKGKREAGSMGGIELGEGG